MVYGCDPAWWRHRRGLPEFTGLKVAWSGAQVDFPDLLRVEIAKDRGGYSDAFLEGPLGRIGGGGNSGFQALNLVVQLGAARVVLIGFDMSDRGGVHWYGRNGWPSANNPDESNFRRWRSAFEAAAPKIAAAGIEVINTSPASALGCFRKASLDVALEEWGLCDRA